MNYQTKFFNLLTICEKSGKLIKGFDMTREAVINKKAVCIMTASDISEKTLKEINFICKNNRYVKITALPFSMEIIKESIGKKVGVMTVCDKGFAAKLFEYAQAERENLMQY